MRSDQEKHVADDPLVLEDWRRRHVVLSVDQLVPLPIIGKQYEVVVGELHAGAGRFHRILPGHHILSLAPGPHPRRSLPAEAPEARRWELTLTPSLGSPGPRSGVAAGAESAVELLGRSPRRRLRSHLEARNTLPRSMLSDSTIGLMAS